MTGLRRALLLVAVEGLVVGLVAFALVASSDHVDARVAQGLIVVFIGWSFIGVGLYAWWRRPENRFGVLMTAVGFAWFLQRADRGRLELAVHDRRAASRASTPPCSCTWSSPSPAAGSSTRRLRVVQAHGLRALRSSARRRSCSSPTRSTRTARAARSSAILIADNETLERRLQRAHLRRWPSCSSATCSTCSCSAGSAPRRRSAARWRPSLWSGVVLLTLLAASLTSEAVGGPDAVDGVAYALAQLAFAITPVRVPARPILRSRVIRGGAVTELLQRMADTRTSGGLRALLAGALGDRSLRVLYWLDEKEAWVDALGRPGHAARPRRPRAVLDARSTTRASASARSSTTACSATTPSSSPASRPPRASRSRTSAWRRSCAPASRSCAPRARGSSRPAPPSAAGWSATCTTAPSSGSSRSRSPCASPRTSCARIRTWPSRCSPARRRSSSSRSTELRELARGIHPAVLSDRGLSAALEALAGRSPVPVELAGTAGGAAPARGRGRGLLRRRRGAHQRGQVRATPRRRGSPSSAPTATRSWRSPTTASAGPIRPADRASAGSPIGSPRSTAASPCASPQGAGTLLRAEIPV